MLFLLRAVGDVLLAYEMNGEELPPEHGFPLRAVVPGHVGVRNVKWVDKVIVSPEEAKGTWQRGMAYKGFGPNVKSLKGFSEDAIAAIPSVQELPVNSCITYPSLGAVVEHSGFTSVKGYAYSGGGRGIIRVDISLDGGDTWEQATLQEGSQQPLDRSWAWTLWEFPLPASVLAGRSVPLEVICKATDSSYNCQPDSTKGIWNIRGIINNAWHSVGFVATQIEEEEDE